ncbi:MAG: hypothetical protein NUV69_02945 [Candidatus Curtissbacteria bacterium]|nr:hypothetical protein [Candidatus Curtissbacteria bacterium]
MREAFGQIITGVLKLVGIIGVTGAIVILIIFSAVLIFVIIFYWGRKNKTSSQKII